jgi:hypothetical protein
MMKAGRVEFAQTGHINKDLVPPGCPVLATVHAESDAPGVAKRPSVKGGCEVRGHVGWVLVINLGGG